ncbi:MAG TPA: hypothetical protein VL334_07990 [Anaerolineae bacterium]|nr:hypothetical protein [Anaerolineae bacterium]
MSTSDIHHLLRALLRDKVHVQPGTLSRLPTQQAAQLRSPLDLGRLLLAPLERAPEELLRFWLEHPRGHAVVNPLRHEYRPEAQPVGRRQYDGVAWVAARRLLAELGLAGPLAGLLDHLLGSDGQQDGPRLSDGAGRSAAWAEVGHRLQRQFNLGYAPPEVAAAPDRYFAWGLRAFLANASGLGVVDPGLERLLRTTLFDSQFWQRSSTPFA